MKEAAIVRSETETAEQSDAAAHSDADSYLQQPSLIALSLAAASLIKAWTCTGDLGAIITGL